MKQNPIDSHHTDVSRKYYDHRTNPCTKDCHDRKAECAKTCPKWAKYASERAERYEHNRLVYQTEEVLRTPVNRDKRGQI